MLSQIITNFDVANAQSTSAVLCSLRIRSLLGMDGHFKFRPNCMQQ